MGIANRAIVCASSLTIVALLAGGCRREPPVVDVGAGWFVDVGLPEKAADRLFFERDGKRTVVDRRIDGYRLYARFCLVYETFRPEGHVVFAVTRGLTPIGITTSDEFERWRIDTDGLRRFTARTDPDGGKLLASEWIDYSDICYVAQEQPPYQENWAQNARFDHQRTHIKESVVDVNARNSVGNSTLHDAARQGHVIVVDELLRAGADVNVVNNYGSTPLMVAVVYNHPEVVRRLIQGPARVDAQDDHGTTALMLAAKYRHPDIAQMLVDAGADRRLRDDTGKTAAAWVPDGGRDTEAKLRVILAANEK